MASDLHWNLAPLHERLARYQARQPWYGNLFGRSLGGVLDREAREPHQSLLIRGIRQRCETAERVLHLLACPAGRIVEAPGGVDRCDHRLELLQAPLLDGAADGGALR